MTFMLCGGIMLKLVRMLICSVKLHIFLQLILMKVLLEQWKRSLSEFLIINEVLPEQPKKRGRKNAQSVIGQLGGSKNTLGGIIDIIVIQYLYNDGAVNRIVENYGMVIVDECHYVSAVSFEAVLREEKQNMFTV